MTEQDYGVRTFDDDMRLFNPQTPFFGDDRLKVKFEVLAIEQEAESLAAGVKIYKDVDHITIYINKDEIIVQPVDDTHKRRWPRQYAAWKVSGSNEAGMSGTPLDRMVGISPSQVADLKYRHVMSIEQLAECPENMLLGMLGAQGLKQRAQSYVQIAKDNAPIAAAAHVMEENKALKERLDKLEAALADREVVPETPKRKWTRRQVST